MLLKRSLKAWDRVVMHYRRRRFSHHRDALLQRLDDVDDRLCRGCGVTGWRWSNAILGSGGGNSCSDAVDIALQLAQPDLPLIRKLSYPKELNRLP